MSRHEAQLRLLHMLDHAIEAIGMARRRQSMAGFTRIGLQ